MKKTIRKHRTGRGFTLIELLVVIVIIAVLAAVIVPQYFARVDDAKRAKAHDDIATLSKLIQTYRMDTGQFPTNDEGLAVLEADPGVNGWKGPYVTNGIPLDPWSNEYVYQSNGDDSFLIVSFGSDGSEGGEGNAEDIINGPG